MLRNHDRGLTVLEVLLATFLLFLLTVGFLTIRQRKASMVPLRDCVEKKWQWLRMADEVEWKLRRWEILAPSCLKAGFSPVERDGVTGFPKVWEIETVSPLIRRMTAFHRYPLAPGHEFAIGQEVVICSEGVSRGTIRQVALGSGRQSMIEVDPAGEGTPAMLPAGAMVVAVRPILYETEPVGAHLILHERRSATERKPLGSGFEEWSLIGTTDREAREVNVYLKMTAGDCRFSRPFALAGGGGFLKPGRWWIRDGDLLFEPWLIASEEARP